MDEKGHVLKLSEVSASGCCRERSGSAIRSDRSRVDFLEGWLPVLTVPCEIPEDCNVVIRRKGALTQGEAAFIGVGKRVLLAIRSDHRYLKDRPGRTAGTA